MPAPDFYEAVAHWEPVANCHVVAHFEPVAEANQTAEHQAVERHQKQTEKTVI